MKNNLIGKVLISFAGILIMTGIYAYTIRPNEVYEDKPVERALTEIEAKEVIIEKVRNTLLLYESPKKYFKVIGETDTSIEVSNYDEVIKKIYTDNGKKEIESFLFNNNKYMTKDNKTTYLLKNIPESKFHKDEKITMKDYKLYISKMSARLTFEDTYIDESGTLNAVLTTIEVSLTKENNNWLIDSLNLNYL